MLSILKKLLRQEGHEHVLTPQHEAARFELRYGTLVVGYLWLDEGTCHFAYSDAFREQDTVQPLVDFPSVDKNYSSEDLWPFFSVRIPSLDQPGVQRIMREKQLDEHNQVALLRTFGQKTIANPFVLEPDR